MTNNGKQKKSPIRHLGTDVRNTIAKVFDNNTGEIEGASELVATAEIVASLSAAPGSPMTGSNWVAIAKSWQQQRSKSELLQPIADYLTVVCGVRPSIVETREWCDALAKIVQQFEAGTVSCLFHLSELPFLDLEDAVSVIADPTRSLQDRVDAGLALAGEPECAVAFRSILEEIHDKESDELIRRLIQQSLAE